MRATDNVLIGVPRQKILHNNLYFLFLMMSNKLVTKLLID